ncbi:MAG: hypothetical protein ACFFG0_17860 [Candidatus Thorarchaeota archaeon]
MERKFTIKTSRRDLKSPNFSSSLFEEKTIDNCMGLDISATKSIMVKEKPRLTFINYEKNDYKT